MEHLIEYIRSQSLPTIFSSLFVKSIGVFCELQYLFTLFLSCNIQDLNFDISKLLVSTNFSDSHAEH